MWHRDGPQGHEAVKIRHLVAHYTSGKGLDIGCGATKLWPDKHVIGVDSGKQWGKDNPADVETPGDRLGLFADESMDFVFSSHLLEHITDYRAALKEWWRVIRPGGYLVLYLPHRELYPRVGQPGANPDHKHDFTPADISNAMKAIATGGYTVHEDENRDGGNGREPFSEYSFLQVFEKRTDGEVIWRPFLMRLGFEEGNTGNFIGHDKRALVIRYGGIGDIIQAASVCPGLKAQGYHVTFNTTPVGREALKHNPHIDEFIIQRRDQVPPSFLALYWDRLHERYGRIINFSGSIEDALLPTQETVPWTYDQAARHKLFNVNYLERLHDIAGVPHEFDCRYYANPASPPPEPALRIAWAVTGSDYHKLWTKIGQAIVQTLWRHPTVKIVLLGNPGDLPLQDIITEQLLKYGPPGGHTRVAPLVGKTTIEQAMTIAVTSQVVVGPETGALNACAHHPNHKVVLLSHSTPENLTKNWINTTTMVPSHPEYPDHRGHNAGPRNYRPHGSLERDPETGHPALINSIEVEPVVDAVVSALDAQEAKTSDDRLQDTDGSQEPAGIDTGLGEPRVGPGRGHLNGGAGLDCAAPPHPTPVDDERSADPIGR